MSLMLSVAVAVRGAATNETAPLLQKALYEEEANRDLEAAIAGYHSVIAEFERSRPAAATAVFRLGECYRKQGRTREAAAQYERVLREFADQSTLVEFSRGHLAGMGRATTDSAPVSARDISSDVSLGELQMQAALLKARLERARKEPNAAVIPELFNEKDESIQAAVRELARQQLLAASIPDKTNGEPPEYAEARQFHAAGRKEAEEHLQAVRKRFFDLQEAKLGILESAIQELREAQRAGLRAGAGGDPVAADTWQQLEKLWMEAEQQLAKQNALLTTLKALGQEELRKALPTVVQDAQLNRLTTELDAAEQQFIGLRRTLGPDHVDRRRAEEHVADMNQKIEQRIEGILLGLKTQADSTAAYAKSLRAELEKAKEGQLDSRVRPVR